MTTTVRTHGLTHVALAVKDPQRSLEFYRRVFGVKDTGHAVRVRPRSGRLRDRDLVRIAPSALPGLLVLYVVASFVHFAHNAEFLTDYPNLPSWLTRVQVYAVWVGITALGVLGYWLVRAGRGVVGLCVLGLYAAIGFDGLLHYTRAPMAAHTAAMNLTIGFEVAAAALLLAAVFVQLIQELRGPQGAPMGRV